MFPIIPNPYLSPASDVTVQNVNFREKDNKRSSTSAKLKVENLLPTNSGSQSDRPVVNNSGGVFAAEGLCPDTLSRPTPTKDLMIQYVQESRLDVKISPGEFLKPIQKTSPNWLRSIKLSPDVHSYNAALELNEEKQVRLRTCKLIAAGEEVICWFSEEIATLMAIPFLTPANIRGNNCYSCHTCGISFETPNPLKIHLALSCAKLSIDTLWIRLHYGVHRNSPHSSMEAPIGQQSSRLKSLGHNYRQSAFKPITPTYYPPAFQPIVPEMSAAASASAAAQIETIVSNMGSSKQGHLCIYCGKIYSRKYGLKIHIRTHTGFKPLKCKYCLRPFGDPSNLNKHVRLHTQSGVSDFKCHLCHKILARRRDLQRHMQTRHCQSSDIKEKSSSSEDE